MFLIQAFSILISLIIITSASPPLPPPTPHFTSSMLNLTVPGNGKQSVTFDWTYNLTSNVDAQSIHFGLGRGIWLKTVIIKAITGSTVSVEFESKPEILRKFLSGKADIIHRDTAVGAEVLKMRFSVEKNRKAKFTLRNVSKADEGEYFCSIRLSNGKKIKSYAQLNVLPVQAKIRPEYNPPLGVCRNPSTDDCLGRGYSYTSAESDQTQIQKMKKLYAPVIRKRWECESAFLELLCYIHQPRCDMGTRAVYTACRSVCLKAMRDCEYVWLKYKSYRLSWPESIDCDSLPDKYCLDSSIRLKSDDVCQGKQRKFGCGNPFFVLKIDSAHYGRSWKWSCSYKGTPFNKRDSCKADVTSKIRQECEGRNSCTLKASQLMFGNPCPKVNSYLSVTHSCHSPWKPPQDNTSSITWLPRRLCQPLSIHKCQDLGYSFTQIPTNFTTQYQAAEVMSKYWPLLEKMCSTHLKLMLCSTYAPRCNPLDMVTSPPCRSLCVKVKTECDSSIKGLGLDWPRGFDCSQMPEQDCVSSYKAPLDESSRLLYPRKLTMGGKCQDLTIKSCQNLGYNHTILPATFFYPSQSDTEFRLSMMEKLVTATCSKQIRMLMCSRYAPNCEPVKKSVIPPCRALCELVWKECAREMRGYLYDLRPVFNCSWLPEKDCISPVTQKTTGSDTTTRPPSPVSAKPAAIWTTRSLPTTLTRRVPTTSTATSTSKGSCVPLTISACQGLGYTYTAASQIFGNQSQAERGVIIQQVAPLFKINCSPDLKLLVCTMSAPKCDPATRAISFPCRSLCERVQTACGSFIKRFGLGVGTDWLSCTWMPQTACISSSASQTGSSTPLPPVKPSVCEPLTISTCQGLGYTHTAASYMVGNESQANRALMVQQLLPLVKQNCSKDLKLMICLMAAPKCDPVTNFITLPCRSLCEGVKKECRAALRGMGSPWPASLDCRSMPQFACVKPSTEKGVTAPKCKKLDIRMCSGIGYTSTRFPNYFKHSTQAEANLEMHQFYPLVKLNCSPKLAQFLCSLYAPPCRGDNAILLPCKELCKTVKKGCGGLMKKFGFKWPSSFRCGVFPRQSSMQCFNGKVVASPITPSALPMSLTTSSMKTTISSHPTSSKTNPVCEMLRVPLCTNLGYTSTRLPNYFRHRTQEEAGLELHQFYPLIKVGCSNKLAQFLCSLYAPACIGNTGTALPCQELCETVKKGCGGLMKKFGYKWPSSLRCGVFPRQSSKQCFMVNGRTATHPLTSSTYSMTYSRSSLTVTERPQPTILKTSPPQIINLRKKNIELYGGSSYTLDCEAEGHPTPYVKWFKNNKALGPSVTGRAQVKLEGVTGRDAGSYRCEATNRAGTEAFITTVMVKTIRLAGGADKYEGRVEIFYRGRWGTICNDYWQYFPRAIPNADVACRMLGLGKALNVKQTFGKGKGPIWLDDVYCKGKEATLWDCYHRTVGRHNCSHREDVGIQCSAPQ